jgi:threonine synthase
MADGVSSPPGKTPAVANGLHRAHDRRPELDGMYTAAPPTQVQLGFAQPACKARRSRASGPVAAEEPLAAFSGQPAGVLAIEPIGCILHHGQMLECRAMSAEILRAAHIWPGVVAHYRDRVHISATIAPITLLEGNTPLLRASRLAQALGGGFDLWIKYEAGNPTGSFKDRGMTAAMTQAVADGAKAVICASTGNTAASAAAYAARAGIVCVVLVPDGKIAAGKLAGALSYGAQVYAINGNFDDGMRVVREATERSAIVLVNNINPARLEGQKTAAFEICDAFGGEAPDWLCLPVGNAGNITSYWMGFSEYFNDAVTRSRPRLFGVQAEGAAPIVTGEPVKHPETVATAIRIGNPVRWREAVTALAESDGRVAAVSDDEILHAYRLVARTEGLFCEPSSAAGLAGIAKGARQGWLDLKGRRVVCVLTGHGLKDPESAIRGSAAPVMLEPRVEALLERLEAGS